MLVFKNPCVVSTSAYLHKHVYVYINMHIYFSNIQTTSTYGDNGQHLAMLVGCHMDFPTNKIKILKPQILNDKYNYEIPQCKM